MAARTVFLLGAIAAIGAYASASPAAVEAMVTAAPRIRAIDPTTSGQIGVNPITDEGDQYQLTDLGPEHSVITFQGSTYHYIEGHTKYLSLDTIVTTISGKPTTTTSEVKVVAATATADATNVKAGDTGLIFAEEVAEALRATADDAIQACGLTTTKRSHLDKRLDPISCVIDKAVKASGADGPLEAIGTDAFWDALAVEVAAQAPEYLAAATAVLASQAQKKKALVLFGIILAGKTLKGAIGAVNIPKQGVGAPTETETDSKKTCDPSKPVDQDSPLCSDPKCTGKESRCTTGDNKGCACALEGDKMSGQVADQDWWDEQQKIIGDVEANPTLLGTAAPSCVVNTDGDAFDGKPAADPASWCVCQIGGTKLIYPTLSQTASPCAFTATPTATISPKVIAPSTGPVTSCRVATLSGASPTGGPYCTCNDNSIYHVDTWTEGGKATTGCSATRTSAPSTATPSAAPSPTGQVFIDIFTNKQCTHKLEQAQLHSFGECYAPKPYVYFECFALTSASEWAKNSGRIVVFSDRDCLSVLPVKLYNNLTDMINDKERPFKKMGAIKFLPALTHT